MKNFFKTVIFSKFLVLQIVILNAQDTYIVDFEKSSLKQSIDSTKEELLNSLNTYELLFFNSGFMNKSASGCKIVMNSDQLKATGLFLQFGSSQQRHNQKVSIETVKFLKGFFYNPKLFLENSLRPNEQNLSHDNVVYLIVKIDRQIIFDKYFLRSSFVGSSNKNLLKLILNLQDLSYSPDLK